MRVLMDREARKTQIVNISEKLFYQKGYENCSVLDIVHEVGVAKGTFFYYFPTKEDVLNEIIARRATQIEAACRKIVKQPGYSREERFLYTVLQINTVVDKKECDSTLHKAENALMHQKSMVAIIHILSDVLIEIVSDTSEPPQYVKEKLMILVSSVTVLLDDGCFQWNQEESSRILGAIFQSAAELLHLDELKLLDAWQKLSAKGE